MAPREKSRTPTENRARQKPKEEAQEPKPNNDGKETKTEEVEEMEVDPEAKKRLEFQSPECKEPLSTGEAPEQIAKKPRATVTFQTLSDSDEESQQSKARSSKSQQSGSETTETTQITKATRNMELMTMESPIRTDGTKTPLRRPEEKRRERSVSRTSDHSSIPDTNDEQLQREEEALHNKALTTDDLQAILRSERHRNKRRIEHLQATVDHVQDNLQEAIYDIETQSRIGAHLVYKRLQEDAKQASLSFTVEGFPKEATPTDKHAFIKWILEASECNDPDVKASLTNTRGEISNTILVTFSSGWHRNKTFQWYTDQYSRRKQQLWWWSQATGRQTHNQIRIRKRCLKMPESGAATSKPQWLA